MNDTRGNAGGNSQSGRNDRESATEIRQSSGERAGAIPDGQAARGAQGAAGNNDSRSQTGNSGSDNAGGGNPPSTALAKRAAILGTVEHYTKEIAKLAPRGTDAAHYVASLRLYLATNPKLLDCTPGSIVVGMLRIAQTGLQLGVSCDLLPFGKACQFNPRYNGIIELALHSGVRSLNADVVREGDFFAYEKGTTIFLRHRKDAPKDAPITHAYAIAEIKQGSFVFDVLSRDEIDEIRKEFSKSWYWTDKYKKAVINLDTIPWYAKKTVVRKISPFLPKNPRFAAALQFATDGDTAEVPEADFQVVGSRPLDDDESELAAMRSDLSGEGQQG